METTAPDEQNQSRSATTAPVIESPIAPAPTSPYADPNTLLVIPRVFINYVVIAAVSFALGVVVAGAAVSALFNANSVENQKLITAAIEAIGGGQQVAKLQPGQRYDVIAGTGPVRGVADAPITIVEFSDFHCQFCAKFFNETMEPLLTNYAGKIKLVYRNFPILGEGSLQAALAAQCANDQGKFWEFHDLTTANRNDLTREAFIDHVNKIGGMDVSQFTTCLDNQVHMQTISEDATYAQTLGVSGTPAFFINGRFVSGAQPYANFAAVIEEELGKLAESTPDPAESSPGT